MNRLLCCLGLFGLLSCPALATSNPSDTNRWDVTLTLGFNQTDGNSDTMLGQASLTAQREKGKNALRFAAEGSYGETDEKTTAQNAKGTAHYKRIFDGTYAYLDGSLLHDRVAKVEYRLIAGPGLGFFLVRNDETVLNVEAGGAYVRERLDPELTTLRPQDTPVVEQDSKDEDEYVALRVAQRFEHKLSETARLWESVEFVPRVEDFGDYLLTAEAGIEAALNAKLSLRLVVQDKYDNTPVSGQRHNDLTVTAGLSCKLWQ